MLDSALGTFFVDSDGVFDRSIENISGVYIIRNKLNGKFYIGSSKDIGRRIRKHVLNLRLNKHCNPHFQYAWNKDGEGSFEFGILIQTLPERRFKTEESCITILEACDERFGYNIKSYVEDRSAGYNPSKAKGKPGRKPTPEQLERMKIAIRRRVGLKKDVEDGIIYDYTHGMTYKNISKKYGVYRSVIHKLLKRTNTPLRGQKLYYNEELAYQRRKLTDVQKKQISENNLKRYGYTPEKRAKIVQDYIDGNSFKTVAKMNNMSPRTVYQFIKESGRHRSRLKKNAKSINEAKQLKEKAIITDYLVGLKVSEIAKKYCVGTCTIPRIVKRNNMRIRKSGRYKKE